VPDDIEKVRRTEERRGKRPIDPEVVAERNERAAAFRKALAHGTDDDLKAIMRERRISPGSPQWVEALRIWREERE
jgi:hypothetical protein